MLNSSSAEQSQSVTLSVADWQTVFAGLYELPAKFSVPVITRLQAELHRMPPPDENDEKTTAEVMPLRGAD